MINHSVAVATYKSHDQAETALRELFRRGFDMTKVSLAGREKPEGTGVTAFYNTDGRMQYWGGPKAFWGEVWSWLDGSAVFLIPSSGQVLEAGPMVGWTVTALEGFIAMEGLSAIGRGLRGLGIPKCIVSGYERELMLGKLILIAHGTGDTAASACAILHGTQSESLEQPTQRPPCEGILSQGSGHHGSL
jgi:hypothetical protein